jgi:hypothetical protein
MQAGTVTNPQQSHIKSNHDLYGQSAGSLSGHIRYALEVLEEHDIEIPDESTIVGIVRGVLDARALLAAVSIRFPCVDRLRALFEELILMCTEPHAEAEVAL